MQLLVGGSSKETGALLREYLADRGGSAGGATVCYGAPTTRQPNLNGACGREEFCSSSSLKRYCGFEKERMTDNRHSLQGRRR